MCRRSGVRAVLSLALLLAALAVPSRGATFGLGTLIEVGLSGTSANGAVLKAGDDATASAVTGNGASFANNTGRWFEIVYQKPTNTLTVTLYNGATKGGSSSSASYNPTGGGAVAANAIWTIPASAFFVTASSSPPFGSSISLSNLTLSGLSGGLNIISPIQQTTLTAARGILGGTVTSPESSISFQGDSNGSWELSGLITMNGILALPAFGPTGTDLEFGFSASATSTTPTVPETSSLPMVGTGLAVLIAFGRKKTKALRR